MNCPNCKYEISKADNFCNNCGQKNNSLKISLKEFLGSFFEEYLSFDTRFFRSIGPLLFKPGFLAKKFFEGKRRTYLNPLRFYVFVSFITFLLAGFADMNFLNVDSSTNLDNAVDEGIVSISTPEGTQELNKEEFISALDQIVQNQDDINKNMMRYISIALFLLMPIFALINHLIFFKRKEYYLEHLILSFNIHTFFLILSILALLTYFVTDTNVFGFVLFCLSIFTVLSMKNYYGTSWLGSIWRFVVSVGTYTVILLFTVGTIALIAIYFSGATDIFSLGE